MAAARGEEEAARPLLLPLAEHQKWWRRWAREAGSVGYLTVPMVVVNLSQKAVQVSSNMMVGHLPGVLPLSSAAIATSLANVSWVQPPGTLSVLSMVAIDAVVVSGTLLAARRLVGIAYSSEEEVISSVAAMVPLVCITVITDCVARGCGWQHLNLGSFYLLGTPMAILLGFVLRMGSRGLWMGIVCGSLSQTTLMSAITFFTDWPKMAEKARERVFSDKPHEPGP